jgi:hypothetical protein
MHPGYVQWEDQISEDEGGTAMKAYKARYLQSVIPGIPSRIILSRAWMIGPDDLVCGASALKAIERFFPELVNLTDMERDRIVEALLWMGFRITNDDVAARQRDVEKHGGTGPALYDTEGSRTTERPGDIVVETHPSPLKASIV